MKANTHRNNYLLLQLSITVIHSEMGENKKKLPIDAEFLEHVSLLGGEGVSHQQPLEAHHDGPVHQPRRRLIAHQHHGHTLLQEKIDVSREIYSRDFDVLITVIICEGLI